MHTRMRPGYCTTILPCKIEKRDRFSIESNTTAIYAPHPRKDPILIQFPLLRFDANRIPKLRAVEYTGMKRKSKPNPKALFNSAFRFHELSMACAFSTVPANSNDTTPDGAT